MKKFNKIVFWGVLFFSLIVSNLIFMPKTEAAISPESFIRNAYMSILKREPDGTFWFKMLSSHESTGAGLIKALLDSPEFNNNISNSQYISVLYHALFGRSPDSGGQAFHLQLMDEKDYSRLRILHDMVSSDEFKLFCGKYDILPGNIALTDPIDTRPDLVVFITNFYKSALNRNPDGGGLISYVNGLANKKIDGANLAKAFIFSKEFKSLNYDDNTFVRKLYNSLFNRNPNSSELSGWTSLLSKGHTRYNILANFVNSDEYKKICNKYNIPKGNIVLTDPVDARPELNSFIFNVYSSALNRKADGEGLHHYVLNLANGKFSGATVATSFINSPEFTNKNLGDSDYIKVLYSAFLQRQPDAGGLTSWSNNILDGYSKHYVLAGIINSQEFSKVCNKYNIIQGRIILLPDDTSSHYNITLQDILNAEYDHASPQDYDADSSKWVDATKPRILEFLDPSNFSEVADRYQFMRLNSFYSITADEINDFLDNWFIRYNNGNHTVLYNKGDIFIQAAKQQGMYVNPMYLVAHACLETGYGKSSLANGIKVNGRTVYNMYGIGAYDGSAVYSASQLADKENWTTPEAAIIGGARFIYDDYINNGEYRQDTVYKMRWNPLAIVYHNQPINQYATDIAWADNISLIINKLVNLSKGVLPNFDIPHYNK
ncbi:MAG: DUF4214 domain-containing protein [Clostridiales bacterium]|nr:DUF4214 domain-containing protein [Clostridiales bacterium]